MPIDITPSDASLAIDAASAASEAITELLRYAKEGPAAENFALEPETVERLADALKMAIDIDRGGVRATYPAGADMLDQLHADLSRFLENWA